MASVEIVEADLNRQDHQKAVIDLAVLPGHRGNGVGRQLLAGAERKARDLGCCICQANH